MGLNFYPQSPRYVEVTRAGSILRELPPFVDAVGLFVNLPWRQVFETLRPLDRIRTLQWYGDSHEPDDTSPYQLIAAFSVRAPDDLQDIGRYLDQWRSSGFLPAAVLMDAHVPGQYRGTGRTAPRSDVADFRPGVP